MLCTLGACAPDLRQERVPGAPWAAIQAPETGFRNEQVMLTGARSLDPEGAALTFRWTLTPPEGSGATLTHPASQSPAFTPDVAGSYRLELVVNDGEHDSLPARHIVAVQNRAPVFQGAMSLDAVQGEEVSLRAQAVDPEGDPVTYEWKLRTRPTGSTAALLDARGARPRLVPDVEGRYQLTVIASDGSESSPETPVPLHAYRPIRVLAHRVLDAEYSKALDRLVMVAESPPALYVQDPVSGQETSVALPKVPTAVSVGPDGRSAVVGHNGALSFINLATAELVRTLPVSCDIFDVVLAGNGFAYAFPRGGQWENIRAVNLTTGAETFSGGGYIYAPTRGRLHPDGTRLYGADNGISPDDVERYNLASDGTVSLAWDSPYHGDHAVCGNLWFSEDGARIFTGCGNIFRTGSSREQDLLFGGALGSGLTFVKHLSHSAAAGRVAAVLLPQYTTDPDMTNAELRFYSGEFLTPEPSVTLPRFVRDGRGFLAEGRFVFFNAAGNKAFVLLQAEARANMLNDFGLLTY